MSDNVQGHGGASTTPDPLSGIPEPFAAAHSVAEAEPFAVDTAPEDPLRQRVRDWLAVASPAIRDPRSWFDAARRKPARDPVGEMLGPETGPAHPVIDAVRLYMLRARRAAVKHARHELTRILADVAERFSATIGEIFLLEGAPPEDGSADRRKLRVVAAHNVRPFIHPISDPLCIVAHVARTKRGYFTNDVKHDLFFLRHDEDSRSELCVPVFDPSEAPSPGLLAVANLESIDPLAFNHDDLERLSAAIGAAVPHLLVLRACSRRGRPEEWIPWCPGIDGWDLTRLLHGLCHEISDAIEPDYAKTTIWYHDARRKKNDGKLFVYATSGYDIEYMFQRTLPVRLHGPEKKLTVTGRTVLSKVRGKVWSGDVSELQRSRKAIRMGLRRYLSCAIHQPGCSQPAVDSGVASGSGSQPAPASRGGISALNVYFRTKTCDTPQLRRALLRVASLIGHLTARFDRLRQRYLIATLHYELYHKPKSSDSDFGVIRDVLGAAFSADGLTIWGVLPERNAGNGWVLPGGCYVVENGTTGLIQRSGRETPRRLLEIWRESGDDPSLAVKLRRELAPYRELITFVNGAPAHLSFEEESHRGYTRHFAEHAAEPPLRINSFLDEEERTALPAGVPQEPSLAYVEDFPPREDEMRRMLVANVVRRLPREELPSDGDSDGARPHTREVESVLGVIRILRRPGTKPFSRCDESLLASVCRFLWKQFLDWEGRIRRADELAKQCAPAAPVPAPGEQLHAEAVEPFPIPRMKGAIPSPRTVEAARRLSRPLPPAMRSTGTLIEELVRDLAIVCHPGRSGRRKSAPVSARLMVRNTAFPSKLLRNDLELRTHASFSLPDDGAEDDDPAEFYQALLEELARRPEFRASWRLAGSPAPQAPRMLWRNFQQIVQFRDVRLSSDGNRRLSGYCIPLRAWSNGGLIEALLAIEIDPRLLTTEVAVPILFGAACRLGAIWGVTDRLGRGQTVVRPEIMGLPWKEAFSSFRQEIASAVTARIYSRFDEIRNCSDQYRDCFFSKFGKAPVFKRPDEVEDWEDAGESLAGLFYGNSPFPVSGNENERERLFGDCVTHARTLAAAGSTTELAKLSEQLRIRRISTEASAFGVRLMPDGNNRAKLMAIPLLFANQPFGYLTIPNVGWLARFVDAQRCGELVSMLSEVLNDVFGCWCHVMFGRFDRSPAFSTEVSPMIAHAAMGGGEVALLTAMVAKLDVESTWRTPERDEGVPEFKTPRPEQEMAAADASREGDDVGPDQVAAAAVTVDEAVAQEESLA